MYKMVTLQKSTVWNQLDAAAHQSPTERVQGVKSFLFGAHRNKKLNRERWQTFARKRPETSA